MKIAKLTLISIFGAALLAGCAGTDQYEITGEVSSAQNVSGPISLEFFEIDPADTAAERQSVHQSELQALGSFTETVEVTSGDHIIVVALVDADGDGACTDGELWAETELTPKDDGTVDAVSLELSASPCTP